MAEAPPTPPVGTVIALALLAGVSWWWSASVFREVPGSTLPEQVRRRAAGVPREEPDAVALLSEPQIDEVLHSNPFSPDRGTKAPAADASGTAVTAGVPAKPPARRFAYKGRVRLGNRQRAIIEELTSQKTHFLEVGQEVAGFKVLDIGENQVVLSDLRTSEEVVVSVTSASSPSTRASP